MRLPSLKILCAVGALATALPMTHPAFADDQPKISREVGPALSEADKALKAKDYASALTHLKAAQAASTHQPYDDYVINQLFAQAYIGQNDYKDALTALEAAASSSAMTPADKPRIFGTIIQLAVNVQDWAAITRYADQLQAIGPLPDNLVEPAAIGYFNSGNQQKAYALAKPVVEAAQAAGKTPPQALADIVTRMQVSSNPAEAAKTLEGLVANYGDPTAWAQLIAITINQTKGLKEAEALNFYRLRMAANAKCTVDDYQTMALVADEAGYPVEAEMYLEHGLANHDITASDKAGSLLASIRPKAARDRATIDGFVKVANARKIGDYDLKLANTYMGYQRYADAAAAAQRAIAKGGLKNPQDAQLVLGTALAAEGQNAQAVDALSKVSGGANGAAAHLWTVYAQRKYGSTAAAH